MNQVALGPQRAKNMNSSTIGFGDIKIFQEGDVWYILNPDLDCSCLRRILSALKNKCRGYPTLILTLFCFCPSAGKGESIKHESYVHFTKIELSKNKDKTPCRKKTMQRFADTQHWPVQDHWQGSVPFSAWKSSL